MFEKTLKLISILCLAALVMPAKRSYLERVSRGSVEPDNCFFDGQKTCYSCKNAAICVDSTGGMTAFDEPCYGAGEVCNIAAEEVEAECSATPANDEPGAECFCNPSLPQPRTLADIYTDHAYLYCDNDFTYYFSCYNGYIYRSDFDNCAPEGPTCKFIGIFPFEDDCDFFYVCEQVGVPGEVLMCEEGKFFDENIDRCNDIPDSSINCFDDDDNPFTGLVPSPIFCSYFYVCDNGTFVSTEGCPPDQIFSEADNECIPDDGSCISTGYCF